MIIEPYFRKLRKLIRHNKLSFAICGAIVATCVLTVISLLLYNVTGTSKLDLSRPGYDEARKQIKKNNDKQDDFKVSGSLSKDDMKKYLQDYRKQTVELKSYDAFGEKLLDDNQLGLTSEQILPSDGAIPSE